MTSFGQVDGVVAWNIILYLAMPFKKIIVFKVDHHRAVAHFTRVTSSQILEGDSSIRSDWPGAVRDGGLAARC